MTVYVVQFPPWPERLHPGPAVYSLEQAYPWLDAMWVRRREATASYGSFGVVAVTLRTPLFDPPVFPPGLQAVPVAAAGRPLLLNRHFRYRLVRARPVSIFKIQ